jgi:phage head maturation protease
MGWWRATVDRMRGRSFTAPVARNIDEVFAAMWAAASGPHTAPITRDAAINVAAVQRARNEICAISTLPLRLYQGPQAQPSWLGQLDPDIPNSVHLAMTLDDLLFSARAWWRVTATDFAGYPLAVRHVAVDTVSLHPPAGHVVAELPGGYDPREAAVWVDGVKTPARTMIRFDSPNAALLTSGARSIRRALLLDALAATYADNPRPVDYFTDSDDPGADLLTEDKMLTFLSQWKAARKASGTGYIPGAVKRVDISAPSPAELQLVELQKQCSLEIALAFGVDPEDVGVSITSRTYFNSTDRATQKVNRTYAPYMRAITDRLSMGDITKRGYTVQFDLTEYLRPDPQAQAAYWEALMGMGAIDAAEVRMLAGLPGDPPAPAPAPAPQPEPGSGSEPAQLRARVAHTFDGPAAHTFAFASSRATFTVDAAARTVAGLAVPYGVASTRNLFGNAFVFEAGSLAWSDTARVKHFRDHVVPIGKALSLSSGADGLAAVLDVQPGVTGDELLSAAAHGTYDGLSVGVAFSDDPADGDITIADDGTVTVHRATLQEISTTATPAFDDARVSTVRASRGAPMPAALTARRDDPQRPLPDPPQPDPQPDPQPQPDPRPDPQPDPPPQQRTFVDPTRRLPMDVTPAAPYHLTVDRKGTYQLRPGTHEFSADLRAWHVDRDHDAQQRVLRFMQSVFDTGSADVAALNPPQQRPELYVDQREYRYPVWDAISKGPMGSITPFVFPKFVSAAGLVGPHTEFQEPTPGAVVVTTQTVTPAPISGKAKLSREAWDQGGNPQISSLVFNQMMRGWYEGLEAAAVKVLVDATPTKITLTTGGGTDGQALVAELEAALADLQFVRGGYAMTDGVAHIDLYKGLAAAKDDAGRPLLPIIGPANANGQATTRFGAIDVAGTTFLPTWALGPSGTVAAPSFLFDRTSVHGWAGAPQQLTMDTTEVAAVYLGIFGYVATAISDLSGVREIEYDPSAIVAATARAGTGGGATEGRDAKRR